MNSPPSNEELCASARLGDAGARNELVENNLGFIRKTANELWSSQRELNSALLLDREDLVQEGCIGLLSAVDRFDAGKGASFLTYAAPTIRNAMTDCMRTSLSQLERRLEIDGLQRVYLDDVLDADERLLRIEAVADPNTQTPEQVVLRREKLAELYAGLDSLTAREQTWLLYRHGFTDGTEHPLAAAQVQVGLGNQGSRAGKGDAPVGDLHVLRAQAAHLKGGGGLGAEITGGDQSVVQRNAPSGHRALIIRRYGGIVPHPPGLGNRRAA